MESKAINGSESFRDASFSYLRSDHRSSADRKIKPAAGDSEISVFAAERYFNAPLHHARPDPSRSDRAPGTPSACSDGSRSTALLLSHRGGDADVAVSRRRRRWMLVEGSRSFFSTLGCTGGACSDDKSVFVSSSSDRRHVDGDHHHQQQQGSQLGQDRRHVDGDHHHHQQQQGSQLGQDRRRQHPVSLIRYEPRSTKRPEDHFAFPILSAAAEPPRMSLEVFGTSKESSAVDEVAANLERKMSVLTWDAIPGVSPKTGMSDLDSDDASSDLFEIENITAAARRVSGEGYEPSEASIEWSVITASGCGGGGDYDEKKISANTGRNTPPKRMGMLGCKSHKSVRVAENNALTTKKP